MRLIKTIEEEKASIFDKEVNTALTEGWELVRRYRQDGEYIAEMEKNNITENAHSCGDCRYYKVKQGSPCSDCIERNYSYWEQDA